jgi:hypothetical protein
MATSSNIVQFTAGSSIADLHGGDFAEEIVALIVNGLDLKGLALKFWFGVECCDAGGRLEIRDSRRDVGGQTLGEMSLWFCHRPQIEAAVRRWGADTDTCLELMSAGKNKRSMKAFQERSLPYFLFLLVLGTILSVSVFVIWWRWWLNIPRPYRVTFFWDAEIVRAHLRNMTVAR